MEEYHDRDINFMQKTFGAKVIIYIDLRFGIHVIGISIVCVRRGAVGVQMRYICVCVATFDLEPRFTICQMEQNRS